MGAGARSASKTIHLRNVIDPFPKMIITYAKLSGRALYWVIKFALDKSI